MNVVDTIRTSPIETQQSIRNNQIRALTSAKAGKIIPLAYIPLLREDRVSRGQLRVRFEMAETPRPLLNAVNVAVHTYFVPFLALPHFQGSLDQLNRSYAGQPQVDGGTVVPFFPVENFWRDAEFYKTLGLHSRNIQPCNGAPLHAYNTLVNWRYRARSKELPQRAMSDTLLATCFWRNGAFSDVVPDFDQAKIDGEVTLNLSGRAPVSGIGVKGGAAASNGPFKETDGSVVTYANQWNSTNDDTWIAVEQVPGSSANPFPNIYAELANQGVQLSLSNIDLAKKTAAFAEIRKQMNGIDDDHIIDLLMSGIRVPDEMLAQPILLDRKETIFGYSERYATDGASLEKSVTRGETVVDVRFRTPPMNTGGIILVTAEIVPEQMFERQKDHFLDTMSVDDLPEYTRDFLDPEKVRIVENSDVDVLHGTPDGTFGYAPLNTQWKRNLPTIGGKFHRFWTDAFSEDRQRLWEVETINPTLSNDFYLANNLHHNVFADTVSDPFEITTIGNAEIIGNTVFGKQLDEDTGDYEALTAKVDTDRIEQE